MSSPYEGPEEHIRNVLQAFAQPSQLAPVRWDFTVNEAVAIIERLKTALQQAEQLQKDKDLYERLYHEYEARDQLDQDRSDYLGSISPLARGAMRGIPDLAGEDRSNRVAGQEPE